MSSVTERIQALQAKREAVEKEIRDEGEALFLAAAREVFAAHPVLLSFGWTQYTPYFNDGEACEFSVHTDYFSIKFKDAEVEPPPPVVKSDEDDDEDFDEDEDDDDDDEDEFDSWSIRNKPESALTPQEKAGKAVESLLKLFADDDYETMFGDHKRVKVTVNGVQTSDYDHD
jgi:hypothetical protein